MVLAADTGVGLLVVRAALPILESGPWEENTRSSGKGTVVGFRLADPRLRIKGPPNEPPWSIGCGSRAGRTADEVETYEAQTKSKAAAHRPSQGIVASIIGRVSLLAGATGLLSELKSALNTIWRTREQSDVKEIVNKKICYSSLDPSLSIQMGENVLISWSSQKQPLAR
jgi:hypothetical protein